MSARVCWPRKRTQRSVALSVIGDRPRELRTVGKTTATAWTIVGEALNLSRAGFGRLVESEFVEIEPDWTVPASPASRVATASPTAATCWETLLTGKPLIIHDVTTDPRTSADVTAMQNAMIGALVNMLVVELGKPVAVLIAQDVDAREWASPEPHRIAMRLSSCGFRRRPG